MHSLDLLKLKADIVALKGARIWALLIALSLTFSMAQAAALNPVQPIRLEGMELFFGIIPAEILRGHASDHEERSMHGGVPRGEMHHLVISVFDSKTRARITDATLTGSVTEPGMAIQRKPLESMSFGGAVSYGNYFAMPNQGPYEIVVNLQRPGGSKTATTRFKYWHPR